MKRSTTATSSPRRNSHNPRKSALTSSRALYKFGRTLGAGTYGIVREAESSSGKVAIKIILKKNVRGNESMVYDELEMLQALDHPNIVHFVDWFESKVSPTTTVEPAWPAYVLCHLTSRLGQILHCYPASHWW